MPVQSADGGGRAEAGLSYEAAAADLRQRWAGNLPDRPVRLATFPLRLEDIAQIRPLGLMASGHVTPSDHLYVIPRLTTDPADRYPVLAVADGKIVEIQWRPMGSPDPTVFDRPVDLRVVLQHSASCFSYLDHLVQLEPEIAAPVGHLAPGQPIHVAVPIKAGQVIGRIGHQTFDFSLIDLNVPRREFVRPEQYAVHDPWKLFTVDPFDYVDEPLRTALLHLNPRHTSPLGGRIGYDAEGTLGGNWYRQGTGGYSGLNRRLDYWVGHLSFAYHYMDPTQVIVSVGDFGGRPRQFQVRGNGPDPASVTPDTGLVRYELVVPHVDDRTGRLFEDYHERYEGVLLVQMLGGAAAEVEPFAGKSPDEVRGFTFAHRLYER
ncbi:MAG: hypothetical protein HYU66_16465 [Armatimonadetes bacterium]|nr:hypothetical protein [Armatimonadota bacterium]